MTIPRPEPKQAIPKHAEKVFEGILFDVYQWEQELFDGTITTFEKAGRKTDSVTVIPVLGNGNVLIVEEEQPGTGVFASLPGGMMDPGEEPTEAALRELKEETGCDSEKLELLFAQQPSLRLEWATYIFAAQKCTVTGDIQNTPGERMNTIELSFADFIEKAAEGELGNKDVQILALQAKAHEHKMQELKEFFGV